jgi:thiopurine S-methyltransferase
MNQEFWHELWEHNEIGFNQQQPNSFLKQYFNQLRLKKADKFFVPLCGKSIDMIWLVEQGYKVTGIELSLIACESFFNDNHISYNVIQDGEFAIFQSENITLLCGDFFKLSRERLGQIEAVYDRAALIALPQDLRKLYVNHLMQLIEPVTLIFLITMQYNQTEMKGPPFSVSQEEIGLLYEGCNIQQLAEKEIQIIPEHLKERGLKSMTEQLYVTFGTSG